MVDDLKLIDNIDVLRESTIVLYGAGFRGVETAGILREAGVPAAYFCDGNLNKCRTMVEGLKILSPSDLKQLDKNERLSIIIASEHVHFIDQIIEDIKWLKLTTDNIFTLFGLYISLEINGLSSKLYGGRGYYSVIQKMKRDIVHIGHYQRQLQTCTDWINMNAVLLVYSSPKTGSSTVFRSLKEVYSFTGHEHWMTLHKQDPDYFPIDLLSRCKHERLDILKNLHNVKIISLTREPISRNLSLLFELLGGFNKGYIVQDIPLDKPFVRYIEERMRSYMGKEDDALNWFENELKLTTNIDIYSNVFDRENGYTIIRRDNIEVLVIKLEKLNSLEYVIAEFIGNPRFKLVNANESDTKICKYLYNQVRKAINISDDILDFYYDDPRLHHFYTDDEITGFRKKWTPRLI